MKKLFFYSLIVTLSSCNFLTETNQQKAEKAIKQYLKENLHDPKSYEPVSFSELDSNFSSFEESEIGLRLNQIEDSLEIKLKVLNLKSGNEKTPTEEAKIKEVSIKIFEKLIALPIKRIELSSEFKPEFIGYEINHTFRAKNSMGALRKTSNYFKLDKDFKIIEF
jgi:hypothetical protein